jgi:hypothetical protein
MLVAAASCTSVSTARVSPHDVHAGDGVEAIAAVQVDVTSAYILFVPIPGVDLDEAINRKLVEIAKEMGADKIANLQFRVTPERGVWSLRRLLGWRSARATGIAVKIVVDAPEAGERTEAQTR